MHNVVYVLTQIISSNIMSNNVDDIMIFFCVIVLAGVGVYVFGYIISIILLILIGLIVFFCFAIVVGLLEAVTETTTQAEKIEREYERALKINKGDIDGARMKFGNTEVYVEGPKHSFCKGLKYALTGIKEYSTKVKIGGKEIGKIKVNTDGLFKFKLS